MVFFYDGKLNLNETINDLLAREISPFSSPLSINLLLPILVSSLTGRIVPTYNRIV